MDSLADRVRQNCVNSDRRESQSETGKRAQHYRGEPSPRQRVAQATQAIVHLSHVFQQCPETCLFKMLVRCQCLVQAMFLHNYKR
jgi:hypothetical protein